MEAIYWIEEERGALKRRLDSAMIEPMHKAGATIIKTWMDENWTEERLEPEDEIPEGFIQESRYGYILFNLNKSQEGE